MLAALNPETQEFHRIRWCQIVQTSDGMLQDIGEMEGEVKFRGTCLPILRADGNWGEHFNALVPAHPAPAPGKIAKTNGELRHRDELAGGRTRIGDAGGKPPDFS